MFGNQPGCKLGIVLFIKGLSFMSSFLLAHAIQVDAATAELLHEFCQEHNASHITNRYQVHFTSPGKFPQPVIVVLLIQQCSDWKLKRVTPFYVQFRGECRCANRPRKSEAGNLLVVIELGVSLPLFIEVKAIFPRSSRCRRLDMGTSRWRCGRRRRL